MVKQNRDMENHDLPVFIKQLVFAQVGKPSEVLKFVTHRLAAPSLEAGEVWVRILAAPINPADLNLIEGSYGVKATLPATAGGEGCGVVEISQSSEFVAGDLVMFLNRTATWASHVTVSSEGLLKLPQEIDPLQAAMLKVNPATAWQLLRNGGELKNGDFIVQNAGNSAVGRCVIQLARDLGVHTISFVRRAEVFEDLRALGGDHVLLDDDTGLAAARDILGGATAALAFNAVGGDSALRLMKLLCQGGSHLTYGAMGRKPVTIPNGLLIFRDLQIRGLWVSRWIETAPPAEVREVYTNLAMRVAAGTLVQAVDSTYSLEDFQHALARLEAPGRTGKVLFVP
jgi:mitochondrial enoyl-[acyl-carrier protein] reductase / trans-2-enoyl-CoA reductase